MKIRVEQTEGQEEIIIRCHERNREVKEILTLLEEISPRITGRKDGETYLLKPSEIYYFESIDNRTFAYGKCEIYQCGLSLALMEEQVRDRGFFRCSKSMIINIHRVASLKSVMGGRIDAALDNGEHVIISGKYAKTLRAYLEGGERV